MKKLLFFILALGSFSAFAQSHCEKILDLLVNSSRTVGKIEMELQMQREKDSKYVKAYEGVLDLALESETWDANYIVKNCLK